MKPANTFDPLFLVNIKSENAPNHTVNIGPLIDIFSTFTNAF